MPFGHEFFHRFEWSNEEPSFSFLVHISFEFFGYIPCIHDDDPRNVLVDRPADISIIGRRKGEDDAKYSAVMIAGHGHFEAVIPAF